VLPGPVLLALVVLVVLAVVQQGQQWGQMQGLLGQVMNEH
jgi:hypothetical protein